MVLSFSCVSFFAQLGKKRHTLNIIFVFSFAFAERKTEHKKKKSTAVPQLHWYYR